MWKKTESTNCLLGSRGDQKGVGPQGRRRGEHGVPEARRRKTVWDEGTLSGVKC